ncbi:MAG: saccharopine dehydrogenase NADP-binding domain-containing protein [Minicystis sp.]
MPARDKDFDLVLFGATGFTGQLVAEYLVKKRPEVRWALAGRSRDKLDQVRRALAAVDPAAAELPIVLGDSLDRAAMDAIARRARVVCTTVGPYAKYGSPLVAACAEAGTAYCDLTGETHWIRAMIDAHHDRAVQTGARIVHCCGFDSIPSDLGVLMLHDHLAKQGDRLAEARYRVVKADGGVSGGTIASMMAIFEKVGDPAVRRVLGNPYVLDPAGSPRGPDGRDAMGPGRDADSGRWTAPFMMAAVNTRIVRRSNALLDHAYGRDFRYDEAIDTGRGLGGAVKAVGISAGMAGLGVAVATGPGRKLLGRFLPAPGEGPSREQRERGHMRIEIRAKSASGKRLVGTVAANRDPGYGETSVMLSEAALCLAQDELPARGGVLTPAVAMGMKLVERLRAAGETYRVD